jgi:lysophospholipase L1-like esterase
MPGKLLVWVFGLLVALVAICVGAIAYQGARAPQGEPRYVALGSSFASGVGLGAPAAHSPFLCGRSEHGYPPQLAQLVGLALVDVSCSGATSVHVLDGGQFFQAPQIDAIDARTELVTITIGGNDVSYVGDLTVLAAGKGNGVIGWLARRARTEPLSADQRDFDAVRARLLEIVAGIRERAPDVRIVFVTYPTILPPQGTCDAIAISEAEAASLRAVGDRLAALTGEVAEETGAVFVDMNALGAGHDACSAAPWVNPFHGAAGAMFHPTLAGATATARAIADALAS